MTTPLEDALARAEDASRVQKAELGTPATPDAVEISTPAGIVRVSTRRIDARTGRPLMMIEIEPNVWYKTPRTEGSGHWEPRVEQNDAAARITVSLVRSEDE